MRDLRIHLGHISFFIVDKSDNPAIIFLDASISGDKGASAAKVVVLKLMVFDLYQVLTPSLLILVSNYQLNKHEPISFIQC